MLARLLRELGWINVWLAGAMLLPAFLALGMGEPANAKAFFTSALLTTFAGLGFLTAFRDCMEPISRRSAFLLPLNVFLFLPLFAALPLYFSDHFEHYYNAYFEAVSGLTTTGASTILNPEILDYSLLLWRSMLEWIGGFFTILIALTVLNFLNVGGMKLMKVNLPHGQGQALLSQMSVFARALMPIYATITIVLTILLTLTGESLLDSLILALSVSATGGFGLSKFGIAVTHNPLAEFIISIFLIIASASMLGLYNVSRNRRMSSTDSREAYYLVLFSGIATLLFFFGNSHLDLTGNIFEQLRLSFFMAASSISTSGLNPEGSGIYGTSIILGMFCLLLLGGMANSTTGGVKIMRLIVLFRQSGREIKRLAHRHDASSIIFNKEIVADEDVSTIWLLFFTIVVIMGVATLAFSLMGYGFQDSMGITVSSLMNAGPAIYNLAPGFESYLTMPVGGMEVVFILMILGRMELVFILVVFSKKFWGN